MIFIKQRASVLLTFLVLLFILSACNFTKESGDPNVLTIAWLTCKSAIGAPIGGNFTGKAVLVWNLHPEEDYARKNSNAHTEQIGQLWITNARYFILGEYSDTKYYLDDHPEDIFTQKLDEVGAFLCVSIDYTNLATCQYSNGFYEIVSRGEADVKLVSWPDKNLIGETHVVTGPLPSSSANFCMPTINTSGLGDHLVTVHNIDIWKWFLKYKD